MFLLSGFSHGNPLASVGFLDYLGDLFMCG